MAAAPAKKVGLLLRGWHELPEVVVGPIISLVGTTFALTGLYLYNTNDGDNRKYKSVYTVHYVRVLKNFVDAITPDGWILDLAGSLIIYHLNQMHVQEPNGLSVYRPDDPRIKKIRYKNGLD